MPARELRQHLPSVVGVAEANPQARQALFHTERGSTDAPSTMPSPQVAATIMKRCLILRG
eukprot:7256263-Prorocentrum_lima.AAC.1